MSAAIRSELLQIKAADPDGLLLAPKAVAWASEHPDSALHKALEWDDAKAGQEYRISQVRQLIRLHVVTAEGEPQLVSLTFDRVGSGGYRDISDVLKSRELTEIMLADALAELERVQAKYARVKELSGVWEELTKVKRRPRARAGDTQTAAPAA